MRKESFEYSSGRSMGVQHDGFGLDAVKRLLERELSQLQRPKPKSRRLLELRIVYRGP